MFNINELCDTLTKQAEESASVECVEDSVHGDAVVYEGASDAQVNWGGCDDPRPILEEGHSYLVDFVEVHSWHTKIKLIGIQGLFNSVCFTR